MGSRIAGGEYCEVCDENHPITWDYCPYTGKAMDDVDPMFQAFYAGFKESAEGFNYEMQSYPPEYDSFREFMKEKYKDWLK